MKHGPMFGQVDVLAAEHRFDALGQATFFGYSPKYANRFGGHAILRVVEIETCGFRCQSFAALRIAGEELAQMHIAYSLVMVNERLPRRTTGQRLWPRSWVRCHGCPAPA